METPKILKINMGIRKNFSKFKDKLDTRPQKGSPALSEVEEEVQLQSS